MKRTKLKKKFSTLRRNRCHWCQVIAKPKPTDSSQSIVMQQH